MEMNDYRDYFSFPPEKQQYIINTFSRQFMDNKEILDQFLDLPEKDWYVIFEQNINKMIDKYLKEDEYEIVEILIQTKLNIKNQILNKDANT